MQRSAKELFSASVNELVMWIEASGGYVRSLRVYDDEQKGRSLLYIADTGEALSGELLRVPQACHLTAEHAKHLMGSIVEQEGGLAGIADDSCWAIRSSYVWLMMAVLLAKAGTLGKHMLAYANTLPCREECWAFPLLWPKDQLDRFPTGVAQRITCTKQALLQIAAFLRRLPSPLSQFEVDDMLWAYCMVTSRTFSNHAGDPFMCPLADFANHANEREAQWDFDSLSGALMFEARDPQDPRWMQGTTFAVHISYGQKSLQDLLCLYGFIPLFDHSPAITQQYSCTVDIVTCLQDMRDAMPPPIPNPLLQLWQGITGNSMASPTTEVAFSAGVGPACSHGVQKLLSFARLACATDADLVCAQAGIDVQQRLGRMLSVGNECAALDSMCSLLEVSLKASPAAVHDQDPRISKMIPQWASFLRDHERLIGVQLITFARKARCVLTLEDCPHRFDGLFSADAEACFSSYMKVIYNQVYCTDIAGAVKQDLLLAISAQLGGWKGLGAGSGGEPVLLQRSDSCSSRSSDDEQLQENALLEMSDFLTLLEED